MALTVMLLAWLSCAGCRTTPMWDDATRKTLSHPVVCGSLPASPGEGSAPQWLLCYSTRSPTQGNFDIHILRGQEFYFLLATEDNGTPDRPFRYDPTQRQWSKLYAGIPAEQHQAVEAALLTPIAREDAKKLMARSDFLSADAMGMQQMWRSPYAPSPGFCAYVPGASAGGAGDPRLPGTDELLPSAIIVLLPSQQPRPSGNRYAAMTAATLLTPVTVVVDGVTCIVWGVAGLGSAIAEAF